MRRVIPALLLSLLVYPGAGQAYNRQWLKALAFAGLFTILSLVVVGQLVSAGGPLLDRITSTVGAIDPQSADPNLLAQQLLRQGVGQQLLQAGWRVVPAVLLMGAVWVGAAVEAARTALLRDRQTTGGPVA